MNKYWVIATLAGFIAWSGFMYYEGFSKEAALCAKVAEKLAIAQQSITVAAQKHVIDTVAKQQTITQGVEHDYETQKSAIDSLYSISNSMRTAGASPAGSSMPAFTSTPSRPHAAAARPFRTKVFKLSAQECDENTEQLYGLQAWIKQQSAAAH